MILCDVCIWDTNYTGALEPMQLLVFAWLDAVLLWDVKSGLDQYSEFTTLMIQGLYVKWQIMVGTILIPVQNSSCYFFSCDDFNNVYLDVCGFLLEVYVFLSTLASDLITQLSSSRIICTEVNCFYHNIDKG